jgi:YesN/AraC family two-component response regulator
MQRLAVLIIADAEDAGVYRSLQLNGVRLEQCALGDAIDCLKREKADVIVLDCGNRVWTGLSTMRQIREAYEDIPIIFLTDMSSEDAAINALKMGAREYFKKPVNIVELKQALGHLLKIKPAGDSCHPGAGAHSTSRVNSFTSDKPQNIQDVVAFIEANLWSPLELAMLAEKAHLSKFHFCRFFKRHIGMNPMKFVASLRIERAKELLKKQDLTVSSVANEVGFKDLSNFIRQFKKTTGVTPRTYRGTYRIIPATQEVDTL